MANFFSNVLIYFLIFAAIIVFLIMLPILKRKKAARIAAENQRQKQEAARQRIEQERIESEEREKQRQIEYDKRIAETEEAINQNPESRKYRLEKTQMEVNTHSMNITNFTPISKSRYIAFDLETTGLDYGANQIVEIGAVLVENGEITKEFHQMVDPGVPMPSDASAVNHITDDMLAGQPKIHQVLPAFLAFIGDDVLAAHNAAFDMRFICQACMLNRFQAPSEYFDTMSLARYWPESENRKLTSLAAAAGIEVDDAHRALSDARTVAAFISATNKRRAESKKKN